MPSIFNPYIKPFRKRMSYKDGVAYQNWASQERYERELLWKARKEQKQKDKKAEAEREK
jgi:hypothetical protein